MILITGASSGIGEACAKLFAQHKQNLILLARREEKLAHLAGELRAAFGVEVHTFQVDVRDRKALEELVQQNPALCSKIRILINNAGLAKGLSFIQDGNPDDWDTVIDTNLKGFLYVLHTFIPLLKNNKEAHIVNMGSVAGRWVYPKGNIYCATKHAVHALSESLRMDLLGSQVRVTEISPGMVETEFSEVRLGDADKAKAVYKGMTALSPQDIAECVYWATSRPSHVNIQEIVIYPTDQASPTLINRTV